MDAANSSPGSAESQQQISVDEAFSQALTHFDAQRYPEAEQLCSAILQAVPAHIDALNVLGVIAQRVNRHDLAVAQFRHALELGGNISVLSYNLGISLYHLGEIAKAKQALQTVLALEPENQQAGDFLREITKGANGDELNGKRQEALEKGLANHNAGQFADAEYWYKQTLEMQPDNCAVMSNLGDVLASQDKLGEAVTCLKNAIAIQPDIAEFHFNLGNILKKQGKSTLAVSSMQQACAIKPGFAEALNNLGALFLEQGSSEEALDYFQKAIAVRPDSADALNNIGTILMELEKVEEAVGFFHKAISIQPEFVGAISNLSSAMIELGDLEAAERYVEQALAIDPGFADAYYNRGKILEEQDKLEAAVADYNRAIAIQPDHIDANWNISLVLLMQGELQRGWQQYEWRLKSKIRKTMPIKPLEMWNGSPLKGKNILVYAEQGIGDEVIFSCCLPDLLALAPDNLFLECAPRLEPLFKRSFPTAQVRGKKRDKDITWMGEGVRLDYAIPIGGLPKFFRNRIEDFPKRKAFLVANPRLVAIWSQRLAALGEGLKIGISWRGGKTKDPKKNKSIPLRDLAPILTQSAKFINLQYGDCTEEIAKVCAELNVQIYDWEDNDPLKDMDNHAALIATLDLVISVDNATVHMGGSLGTPTWDMLITNQNWPWIILFNETTPFYQNVRLFRKNRHVGWDGVIKRVATALAEKIDLQE